MSWLAELKSRVNVECARIDSARMSLLAERERISRQLGAAIARLGYVAEAREQVHKQVMHERVVHAFQSQRFDTLTRAERRYAAKRFETFAPQEMQAFLAMHPPSWETFAKECFRRWDELSVQPTQFGYYRLLCLAPASIRFLHGGPRLTSLVADTGPATLARTLDVSSLSAARKELQARGWAAGWDYTAMALARWAHDQADRGYGFAALWSEVVQDATLEAMLLPRRFGSVQSWFSEELRPGGIRPCVSAHAWFVAALVRAASRNPSSSAGWETFTEHLLRSEFRDPRMQDSPGWAMTRKVDPDAYRALLEVLVTEDLRVFFEHAMNEPERKAFWMRYVSSVQRSICILDRQTKEALERQLGVDKKLRAAIARTRTFSRTSGAHAFCLYFESIVVVEFSEMGNAAYIYDRHDFERRFQAMIDGGRCATHADLKDRNLAHERIVRASPRWEQLADAKLARFDVYPETRRRYR